MPLQDLPAACPHAVNEHFDPQAAPTFGRRPPAASGHLTPQSRRAFYCRTGAAVYGNHLFSGSDSGLLGLAKRQTSQLKGALPQESIAPERQFSRIASSNSPKGACGKLPCSALKNCRFRGAAQFWPGVGRHCFGQAVFPSPRCVCYTEYQNGAFCGNGGTA